MEGGGVPGVFHCGRIDVAVAGIIALIQGYFVLATTARAMIPRGSAAHAARAMAKGLLGPDRD